MAAADRAALLVHDHATALSAIGAAYSLCTTDQARAASFIERALALDPNNAWAWMRAGWMKTMRSEEHTSELQSLMRISYAVFCLKKKKQNKHIISIA